MSSDSLHQVDVATDPVTRQDVVSLAAAAGPHASLLMPTPRMGPETRLGAKQYARLCGVLRHAALARGLDPALVDRVEAVPQRHDFWQHQPEGLAVVAGPAGTLVRPINRPPAPQVAVGTPRLRPLLPHVTDGATFHLLALSTGRVRLYEGTEHTMRELDLGSVPASYDDLAHDRDPQASLQWAPQGGRGVTYHAHGNDAAAERAREAKFFRLVSQELRRRLPVGADVPLLLACVPENVALFRAAGGHPALVQDPVDLVVCRVLAAGGHCAVQPPELSGVPDGESSDVVALLRW